MGRTYVPARMTLCWDCAKATGGCSWSEKLKPVQGWVAQEAKPSSSKPYVTYLVIECPLFERDGIGYGAKKFRKEKQSA